jgi:stress-induced morphogen
MCAMQLDLVQKVLSSHFADAQIDIQDMFGDGQHIKIYICSSHFNGKSLLAQHRMVYDVLGEIVGGKIHAVSLQTKELT